MNVRFFELALVALACMCAGCVSAGRRIDESKVAQIVKGESTRADVERLLGTPDMATDTGDGTAVLMYMHMRMKMKPQNFVPVVGLLAGGAETKSETVMVMIGSDGKVRDVSTSHMQMDLHTGLIGGSR